MTDGTTEPPKDLGAPASWLVLEKGAPVYSCDGAEIGKVADVRGDEGEDIFDGIVVDSRYVTGDQVEEIFERGVLLKLDEAAASDLPAPPN